MRSTAIIGIAVLPIEAVIYCFFYLVPDLPALPVLIGTVSLLAFATGVYSYTVSISRFRWASKAQAGTDYALQSSFWNLGVWVAGSTSGIVAGQLGWLWFFPIAAVAAGAGGLFYIFMWDRIEAVVRHRETLELESETEQLSA
jgi:predicted MFS family arabinose efflux permease